MDLIRALKEKGHDVVFLPMYLPPLEEEELNIKPPVFFGAISVYLRQKLAFLRKLPLFFTSWLDARWILKWIARRTGATDPDGMEEMTVSVMLGEHGAHGLELDKLISWLKEDIRPDVVQVSTALLIGIALKIKKELGIPVFSVLQDEDAWIDRMKEPYPDMCWEIIRKGSEEIDAMITASSYYAEFCEKRAGIRRDRIHVVPTGINVKRYNRRKPSRDPLTIGYLSRMADTMGLGLLVESYIELKKKDGFKDLRLKVYGGSAPQDRKFISTLTQAIAASGHSRDVDLQPELRPDYVSDFFEGLTVLCVPVPHGEAFGVFLLESMASGIPVIQPESGAYPEIIAATGGGACFAEITVEGLTDILTSVLNDARRLDRMSEDGYTNVVQKYSIESTSEILLEIYKDYIEGNIKK